MSFIEEEKAGTLSNNVRPFVLSVARAVEERAIGDDVHERRRNGVAGERRVRRAGTVADVLPVAVLRRQTIPLHVPKSGGE